MVRKRKKATEICNLMFHTNAKTVIISEKYHIYFISTQLKVVVVKVVFLRKKCRSYTGSTKN